MNAKKYRKLTETEAVDTAKVNCFKTLINELEKAEIATTVVISPAYSENIDGRTVALAVQICSGLRNVKFLNFTHDALCKQPQYFYDVSHLNKEGAKLFSDQLATIILSNNNVTN